MGDGGCQFAERCDTRYMRECRLRLAQCLFGVIGADRGRDIGASATIAEKLAFRVKQRLAA